MIVVYPILDLFDLESKLIDFHMNFSPYEQPLDEFLSQDLPAESTEEFISIEGVSFYGNNVLFRRLFSVLSSFVDLEFRSVLSFELDTSTSRFSLSSIFPLDRC